MKDKTAREQVEGLRGQIRALETDVQKRLDAIELRCKELEIPLRDLETEWASAYEKFRNLYARISKRMQREAANGDSSRNEGASGMPSDINPLAARILRRNLSRVDE